MHRWLFVIALAVAPAAVAAQSATGDAPAPSAQPNAVYGPPAPTTDDRSKAPAMTPKAASTDDVQSGGKHHRQGRRRGAYLGADGGGQG